jgi:uncharacterized protein YigE (DUF2233 family)
MRRAVSLPRAARLAVPWLGVTLAVSALCAGRAAADWTPGSARDLGTLEGGAAVWERTLVSGETSVRLTGVSFTARGYTLRVADNPWEAPLKLAQTAAAAGEAVAGCNASYFHSDGRPLGLVVADGTVLHRQERAKLLSGILAVRGGRITLERASAFRGPEGVTAAVQAGPWLVASGQPVAGLDEIKRARRTLVATDGRGRWAIAITSHATLADIAHILASGAAFPSWQPQEALNLDGGGSSALWAATSPEPLSIPEFGNVKNFLLVVPR